MTKSNIPVLTPEIVAAVFAELECTGEGEPTEKGWGEIMETGGIAIAASNAVRRAVERNSWDSVWPLVDHLEQYFAPLADDEAKPRANAVLAEMRAISRVQAKMADKPWEAIDVISDDANSEFENWGRNRQPATRCLGQVVCLARCSLDDAGDGEPGWVHCSIIGAEIAQLLANEVSDSAAREFVTSLEAL